MHTLIGTNSSTSIAIGKLRRFLTLTVFAPLVSTWADLVTSPQIDQSKNFLGFGRIRLYAHKIPMFTWDLNGHMQKHSNIETITTFQVSSSLVQFPAEIISIYSTDLNKN